MLKNSLSEIPFFQGLSDNLIQVINAALKSRSFTAGEVIFNYGDPGNELFVVKQGKIAIYMPEPNKPPEVGKPIRIFEPGQTFGEMALIDHKTRSLSARAETDAVTLALDGETFRHLITTRPEIAANAMAGLSERVRYTTEFLNTVRAWVQRITKGDYAAGQFNQEIEQIVKNADKASAGDKSLVALAAEFAEMVMQVKKREEALQEQIAQLKIEIDQSRRKEEVQQIIGSDYYQSLRARVQRMREEARQNDEDEN